MTHNTTYETACEALLLVICVYSKRAMNAHRVGDTKGTARSLQLIRECIEEQRSLVDLSIPQLMEIMEKYAARYRELTGLSPWKESEGPSSEER